MNLDCYPENKISLCLHYVSMIYADILCLHFMLTLSLNILLFFQLDMSSITQSLWIK